MAFTTPNDRIFYACQAVMFEASNTESNPTTPSGGAGEPTFLTGVSSVGVNTNTPSESLIDVGRFQQRFHYYGQQEIEITIERVIDSASDLFYTSSGAYGVSKYGSLHLLAPDNLGVQGLEDSDDRILRHYHITLLYGADQYSRLGSNTADGGDANKVFSTIYPDCLLTNISYKMSVDGPVTESITLITKSSIYSSSTSLSAYNLPTKSAIQSGNTLQRSSFDFTSGSSLLPEEVTTIFDLSTTLEGQKVLGINSIDINIGIEYNELTDVGQWRGAATQKQQNRWRFINLPIQITAGFTGTARQQYPASMPNRGALFSASDGSEAAIVGKYDEWTKVDRKIRLAAKTFPSGLLKYFIWDLGERNYLTDISVSGGDSGGGNVETTMTYQNDCSDAILVKADTVVDISYPTTPF
jgi:hypothetical protein